MKCREPMCTKGIATGDALFRTNPVGEPGVWACREHMPTDQPIHPTVDLITAAIEKINHGT